MMVELECINILEWGGSGDGQDLGWFGELKGEKNKDDEWVRIEIMDMGVMINEGG